MGSSHHQPRQHARTSVAHFAEIYGDAFPLVELQRVINPSSGNLGGDQMNIGIDAPVQIRPATPPIAFSQTAPDIQPPLGDTEVVVGVVRISTWRVVETIAMPEQEAVTLSR